MIEFDRVVSLNVKDLGVQRNKRFVYHETLYKLDRKYAWTGDHVLVSQSV